MRIKTIEMSWFRGAADCDSRELNSKSMVVYGQNGSGKSSFVDAVEYAINGGRIRHLAHEYSGTHQEKGIPNTHKPEDQKTELGIEFKDNSKLKIEIDSGGAWKSSGAKAVAMSAWDYRRTVLRQDEVAEFIHATKGVKYSALLPLLGLGQMEVAAENLRQLVKVIQDRSKLSQEKAFLAEVNRRRQVAFGTDKDDQILKRIEDLHASYCAENKDTEDPLLRCAELEKAIDGHLAKFSADQKKYFVLREAAEINIKENIGAVRAASVKLADVSEPLITEKLEVLQSTGAFVDELGDEEEVKCPACGRNIPVDVFQTHVTEEKERLQEVFKDFNTRKAAIGTLSDSVTSLKSSLAKAEVQAWRDELDEGDFSDNLAQLDQFDTEELRLHCDEEDLNLIEDELLPLVNAANLASKDAPLDVQQLSADKHTGGAVKEVIEAKVRTAAVDRAEALVSFIKAVEQGTREEIRQSAQTVINEISKDMQAMWAILHPDEAIEEIRLYLPKDAAKAIDIGLNFYGVEQDSPKLTLSEGYRNSLGLCIFLAMAKREADKGRPLFLDDVVISLDRHHRGMVADLVETEFGNQQVIILTHDRDWYTDLRHQLDDKRWTFRALLPYKTPDIGIRWSDKTTTFGDARDQIEERPDAAGNDARKIMDVELAFIAERLQIKMPYLRADKNDRRAAHDFLGRLITDGKRCFQKKVDKEYVARDDAIAAFEKADGLLISWANRGSHSFDVVRPEATKLIGACETALEFFKCSSCGKGVWYADARSPELVQCECAEIRWRYGKG